MCKIVYLTTRLFDAPSNRFKKALAGELRKRDIEVVTDTTFSLRRLFRRQHTYGMSIAIDFFRDGTEGGSGSGLVLSEKCSFISRDFAYSLSNVMDDALPRVRWRDFRFVSNEDKTWKKFFKNIHSETKAIFYLCTYNRESEYNMFMVKFDEIVRVFADEIVRCLKSNYNVRDYHHRVKQARLKLKKSKTI